MNPKPSLYATLPVGTVVDVLTGWVNTSSFGSCIYRHGEVLEDQGEEVRLLITVDGYGRPGQIKQTFHKSKITKVIRGPLT